MSDITLKLAQTESERLRAYAIRVQVFVLEQGVPLTEEMDSEDPTATHTIAYLGGVAVGTGRLVYTKPSGTLDPQGGEARIGRMAVLRAWRRKGLGGRILKALEDAAREKGACRVALHAQTYVKEFYSSHGYVAEGVPFVEVGIEHLLMCKTLS